MTNTTQAARPAAVDLVREREYWAGAPRVLAILADLRATRNERDAARAALPDAQMLDSYAAGIEWEGFEADGLRKAAAAIRALDPAPVPAADVADVPAFLAHRVTEGQS